MKGEYIPSYVEALYALKSGNQDVVKQALFCFRYIDALYVGRVKDSVRALLQRSDLTPSQITSIGRVLHGLDRLPLRTPGLDVHLWLWYKEDDLYQTYDLTISADWFITDSGRYGDSDFRDIFFNGNTFSVRNDGREYVSEDEGEDENESVLDESWPDQFYENLDAHLKIEDASEDALLDWGDADGSIFWEWIYRHD